MADTTSTRPPAGRWTHGLRVARSRGALSGLLLVLLGLWGALIPFIGPYFDYAYTPDVAWTWTWGRLWLEVLPGIAAIIGGLMIATTTNRAVGMLGGWLAAAGGAWYVVGPVLGRLWGGPAGAAGTPVGGTVQQVVEQIGFFAGLGVVIVFLGAHAVGRFSVRSVKDVRAAERAYGDRVVDTDGDRVRETRFDENTAVQPAAEERVEPTAGATRVRPEP